MISSGTLLPGSRIDERAIAEQMGVSRTPLRGALTKLAEDGLIEQRPYRGAFVRAFTAKQADDLYETRKVLEGLAIRLAVSNLSDENLAELRIILDDIRAALEHGDMNAYAEADQRFHTTVARAANNEALMECLDRLKAQIQLLRVMANQDPDVLQRTAHERPLILAALEARDADRAAELMEEHIDGVRRAVIVQVKAFESTEDDGLAAPRKGEEVVPIS